MRHSEEHVLRRNRSGPLVVERLTEPLFFFRHEFGEVLSSIAPCCHPVLHGRACGDLLEPALAVWELVHVLPLRVPMHGPGVTNHIGNRVDVAHQRVACR
jgi:hypothetical protein